MKKSFPLIQRNPAQLLPIASIPAYRAGQDLARRTISPAKMGPTPSISTQTGDHPQTPLLPAPALPDGYTLHPGYPSIPDYLHLRAAAGLSPKTPAQAAPIASGSWYGCYITFTPAAAAAAAETSTEEATPATTTTTKQTKTVVAMGRIIGDGGWYFHVADMAVLPAHQRRGLGDAVLKHLLAHIRARAPPGDEGGGSSSRGGPYVTLFADGPGRRLYARNGFVETAPGGQLGMMLPMGWEKRWGQ
ncbi:hypothetical protein VTK56DRAFT_6447 [Thermocarpiscus australiensis]